MSVREHIRQRPLAKMWRERQLKNKPRMQGTECIALEQIERNRTAFRYPKDGFEQKIEFSLLYAMLSSPDTYPKEVVHTMVDEEDFLQYIHTTNGDVSYAQLSAILAYAAECNPADIRATALANAVTGGGEKKQDETDNTKEVIPVSQKLCKKLLRAVVRYAEQHEPTLDRETEISELLTPVKRVAAKRIEKKELQAILPLYIGYSAALLTANPLPLIVGAMGMASAPSSQSEMDNVNTIITDSVRVADVERTGLLDEEEEDF